MQKIPNEIICSTANSAAAANDVSARSRLQEDREKIDKIYRLLDSLGTCGSPHKNARIQAERIKTLTVVWESK